MNAHLCPFALHTMWIHTCINAFFFMKECQSIHLYIFRTPFHWWWPISICSAVVQLKVYVKVQLTSGLFFFFFFFFNELLCSETLFPSCCRHRKTFFMNTLFFHFLSVSIMSCISELSSLVDSPDMTRGALRLSRGALRLSHWQPWTVY